MRGLQIFVAITPSPGMVEKGVYFQVWAVRNMRRVKEESTFGRSGIPSIPDPVASNIYLVKIILRFLS
jgi:hypothetical protein